MAFVLHLSKFCMKLEKLTDALIDPCPEIHPTQTVTLSFKIVYFCVWFTCRCKQYSGATCTIFCSTPRFSSKKDPWTVINEGWNHNFNWISQFTRNDTLSLAFILYGIQKRMSTFAQPQAEKWCLSRKWFSYIQRWETTTLDRECSSNLMAPPRGKGVCQIWQNMREQTLLMTYKLFTSVHKLVIYTLMASW